MVVSTEIRFISPPQKGLRHVISCTSHPCPSLIDSLCGAATRHARSPILYITNSVPVLLYPVYPDNIPTSEKLICKDAMPTAHVENQTQKRGPEQLTFYPAYCFSVSPTYNAWVRLTARLVHGLQSKDEFDGMCLFCCISFNYKRDPHHSLHASIIPIDPTNVEHAFPFWD